MQRKQNLTKGPNESLSLNETDGRKMVAKPYQSKGISYWSSICNLHSHYMRIMIKPLMDRMCPI